MVFTDLNVYLSRRALILVPAGVYKLKTFFELYWSHFPAEIPGLNLTDLTNQESIYFRRFEVTSARVPSGV